MHIIQSYWCIRVFRRSKELFDKGYTAYFHLNGTGKKKILMSLSAKGLRLQIRILTSPSPKWNCNRRYSHYESL